MLRLISRALVALAMLSAPLGAQTFTLPELGLQNSGACRQLAARDRTSGTMVPLGCLDTATRAWKPLGDASAMSAAPNAFADPTTLSGILGRTGGSNPNLWYNPDGSLGNGTPQTVLNDGLSIYGPNRWVFQQVTLTPYVTGQRVTAADGSTSVRMLNGYAATGAQTIATGTRIFTVAPGLNFAVGFPVKAVSLGNLSQTMTGTVASYTGTALTLNITSTTGSGTYTDWVIGASGYTKQGQTKLLTTAPTPAGSSVLNFADTSAVQIGANIEFAFDANFATINGIQRGTYVVSKTPTTVTMSQPAASPAGAPAGSAVVAGQQVTFYGDQGVFLFQDIQAADAGPFRFGTPQARDVYLSFDVVSNVSGTASVMLLGYNSISTLGRSYVQSFPITTTKTRITLKIKGDTGGLDAGTWKAGYGANSWGGLWGAWGFALGSQGTPTSRNIPDGRWYSSTGPNDEVFAVGGSDQQSFNMLDQVGTFVDITNVKMELDKPTTYEAPTSQSYPSARLTAKATSAPEMDWEATGNPTDQRNWRATVGADGSWRLGALNDARTTETAPIKFLRDGSAYLPAYPAGTLSIDTTGKIGSTPNAFTPYTPGAAASVPGATPPTFGTTTGRYRIAGKTMFVQISVPVTAAGTGSGVVVANLPTACSGAEWSMTGFDAGLTGKPVFGRIPASSATVQLKFADGSYPGATNAVLNASGFCELP